MLQGAMGASYPCTGIQAYTHTVADCHVWYANPVAHNYPVQTFAKAQNILQAFSSLPGYPGTASDYNSDQMQVPRNHGTGIAIHSPRRAGNAAITINTRGSVGISAGGKREVPGYRVPGYPVHGIEMAASSEVRPTRDSSNFLVQQRFTKITRHLVLRLSPGA
eukprot:2724219-Rhodomonas_salina.1